LFPVQNINNLCHLNSYSSLLAFTAALILLR
jgi:hypothetical protein